MFRRALPFALLLFACPPPAQAQSARAIMDEVMERYADRMEGIDDYRVTQTVMGMETTLYFTREEGEDGRVTFVPDFSELGDEAASGQQYDSNYFMRDDFVSRMRVEGKEVVDGHQTHVLVIDDFTDLDLSDFSSEQNRFEPELIRMFMDEDEYIPRRLDMSGTTSMSGEVTEMSTSVLMTDYREVDGMLYPFTVEISTEGLGDAMGSAMDGGMTEEQRSQIEKALEKVPESQREMVRRMMEAQMEGGASAMMNEAMSSIEVKTLRLTVNSGPRTEP